jgi:protein AATF/BFR2
MGIAKFCEPPKYILAFGTMSMQLYNGSSRDLQATSDAAISHSSVYEKVLNYRINLQKSIDLCNFLPLLDAEVDQDEHVNDVKEMLLGDEELASSRHELLDEFENILGNMRDTLFGMGNVEDNNSNKKDSKKKKRKVAFDWDNLYEMQKRMKTERWEPVINKCYARVNYGSEQKKSSMKVFKQTLFDQMDIALADEDRLIEKSRMLVSESKRMNKEKETSATHDLEVYDDRIFYSMLLKSFITSTTDANTGSMRAADLEALRKYKRNKSSNVDRKASKGRKLRYVVHEKLTNFMFPIPANETVDSDRIMASLFQ